MKTIIKPFQIRVNDVIKFSDVYGTHTLKVTTRPRRIGKLSEIFIDGIIKTTTCKESRFRCVGQSSWKAFRNNLTNVTRIN
jgi:hypothetical protein|tara:strand:+ start:826 stop:1068 length:243 start_codon:yes stop_codon:yes gene_type:complete